jgi:lysine 2,3-aminomutase
VKDEALQERLLRYEELRQHTRLLPVKVTAFYRQKLEREFKALGHEEGPLHRIVYPSNDRLLQPEDLKEVEDHVNDRSHMPSTQSSFLHKYPDRVLFMPTSECLSHCMYCFRQDLLEERHENKDNPSWKQHLNSLLDYLKIHPEVSEVILSGGDPFLLPSKALNQIFHSLKKANIQHLRIHTRSLVFNPESFTKGHMTVCHDHNVRVILHVTHPYEWCKEVSVKAREWSNAGIRLYNQFPILRKINDHPSVLANLVEKLDEDRVRTLSIYLPDPVKYSSCYRVPYHRLVTLIKEFKHSTPSWINGLRFSQDSPIGKLGLDELELVDPEKQVLIYRRGSEEVRVPDLPSNIDETFDIKTLLWEEHETD